jgi:hypothetical protein
MIAAKDGLCVVSMLAGNQSPSPDFNGDGAVDSLDLAILMSAWGASGSADRDGDGAVGTADLGLLLCAWG